MARQARYWDSDAFIGWLGEEEEKLPLVRPVIEAAKGGRVLIVTSAITITEVIKLKSRVNLPQEKWERTRDFFRHEWISIRQLDFRVAELAREYIWTHNLAQKDAVHVATAVRWKIARMDTFDEGIIRLSGRLGNPLLTIGNPDLPEQPSLWQP